MSGLFSLFLCLMVAPSSSAHLIEYDTVALLERTDLVGDQLGLAVQRHQDRVAFHHVHFFYDACDAAAIHDRPGRLQYTNSSSTVVVRQLKSSSDLNWSRIHPTQISAQISHQLVLRLNSDASSDLNSSTSARILDTFIKSTSAQIRT